VPELELAARYRAASAGAEVGGDFYDAFAVGEGAWGFAVGDVCGRGPQAAALTGLMHSQNFAARSESLVKSARSVVLIFEWMPLSLLPIALAQAYGERATMDWSTFSWWLRRQRGQPGTAPPPHGVNVLWPYFVLCLLATSAANERSYRFTVGLGLLVAWAAWSVRPRRRSVALWGACFLAALGIGLAAQLGLRQMQRMLQRFDAALLARLSRGDHFSDKEVRTSLGEVGRLKLSGRIVLRVETNGMSPPPSLLREACYNLFRSPIWTVGNREFLLVNPETNITTTILLPGPPGDREVIISSYFSGGAGLLPVPLGVRRIDELNADIETNRLGAVRIKQGPGFARFHANYGAERMIDAAPGLDDLDVPTSEKSTLDHIVGELHLADCPPEEALRRVEHFFAERFHYTTWNGPIHRPGSNQTALARFLLHTRAGHCEYFATATTLLLRRAGIRTRYVLGHSVQEKKGHQWVVRERHGHAWCLAWINDAWRDVDTTPPNWGEVESSRADWMEAVSDFWSRLWFEFSKWRWGKGTWKQYALWLLVPLIGLAGWRLMSQKQWRRSRGHAPNAGPGLRPGLDSEFYAVEAKLLELGLERRSGETLSGWLQRLESERGGKPFGLQPLLTLHYRLRFDPSGLPSAERDQLRAEAAKWLEAAEMARTRS